ncbi:MAG: hypothetical protein ACI4HI_16120 [Lachnospiraceae bacterium]
MPMKISQKSILLAKQARKEHLRDGYISLTCPKCHEHPVIRTTSKGERMIISCECGYIKDIEINL